MAEFLSLNLQDEYSMISQAYTVDVHGYVLVYSVTSQKRYAIFDIRRGE